MALSLLRPASLVVCRRLLRTFSSGRAHAGGGGCGDGSGDGSGEGSGEGSGGGSDDGTAGGGGGALAQLFAQLIDRERTSAHMFR